MNELRAISIFVQAVELGSFNQVAIERGLTSQAVSKSIRQLETYLGIRLFHRTTRNNTLTEDGQRFLEAVAPQLHGLQEVLANARNSKADEQGSIRVSAARPVGRKVLLPVIAEFHRLYPLIDIELILDERLTDIVTERIDVGFRAGSPPESQVVTRKLFPLQDIPCASPAYLKHEGVPKDIDSLIDYRCTGYRNPTTGRLLPWEFKSDGSTIYRNISASFCTNDPEAEMEAVVAGLGIGLIDSINAIPRIRAGELIPLLVDHVSDRRGLYIFYAQRDNLPMRVRLFIDFCVERLLGVSDFYLGTEELRSFEMKHKQVATES